VEGRDLSRIAAFSDGVMAVAITLLVLNIDTPSVSEDKLGEALVDLLPSVLAYLLSFALIGRYWVIHHQLFSKFVRFDGRLVALNLLFLMLIALVPFSTDLYDQYTDAPLAAAVFAGSLAVAALVHCAMTVHATKAGLVETADERQELALGAAVALGICAVFLLSVPVAFISTTAAWIMWASLVVLRYPLRRAARWVSR
jgi:TMEM175 potassium channel family protein